MKKQVVIAGWGQVTQPKAQTANLCNPLGLMVAAALKAGKVTGMVDTLRKLDGIMVVRPLSAHYPSAARQLAEKIGASPRFTIVSKIGGNSPQSMVNKAAGMIARGELETVLIAGAEAYYPRGDKRAPSGTTTETIPSGALNWRSTTGFISRSTGSPFLKPLSGPRPA